MGKVRKLKPEKQEEYLMMEYVGVRRLLATPMKRFSARLEKIKESVEGETNDEGFWVKEPIGTDYLAEYWMPKDAFESNHIKTKNYTIGEIPLLLAQGATIRRVMWPQNKWLRLKPDLETEPYDGKSKTIQANYVEVVEIFPDPIKKDVHEFRLSHWAPTEEDFFAKDYQVIKLNFDEETNL